MSRLGGVHSNAVSEWRCQPAGPVAAARLEADVARVANAGELGGEAFPKNRSSGDTRASCCTWRSPTRDGERKQSRSWNIWRTRREWRRFFPSGTGADPRRLGRPPKLYARLRTAAGPGLRPGLSHIFESCMLGRGIKQTCGRSTFQTCQQGASRAPC